MAVIGTFGSFTAARLGIYASQASLNITGNNIANINTEGYTRQRADLVSLYSYGTARYANSRDLHIGYGVLIDSVSQLRDPFLDIRFRDENAKTGAYEAKLDCLQQLAGILDEVGKGNDDFGIVAAQFEDFLSQLQNLNGKVGSVEYDTTTRGSAQTLTQLLNDYAKAMDTLGANKFSELQQAVKTVNSLLTEIRDLSVQIRDAGIAGDPALELRDARNLCIDQLSSYMKIDVSYDMEKIDEFNSVERINISIADSGNPPIKLIQGVYGAQISMPEYAAMRNPNYDANNPAGYQYISYKSDFSNPANPKIVYTNNLREAYTVDGQALMNEKGALKDFLEKALTKAGYTDKETNDDGTANAKNLTKALEALEAKYAGTYAEQDCAPYLMLEQAKNDDGTPKVDNDGNPVMEPVGTWDEKKAERVPNAVKDDETNRLWMTVEPLTDAKGRYMRDENHKEIKESVDLSDTVLYGSLQSMREFLTEKGEFSSADDLKFDKDAAKKRGLLYYKNSLDALARKFADAFNKANRLNIDDVSEAYVVSDVEDPTDPTKTIKAYVGSDGKVIEFKDSEGNPLKDSEGNEIGPDFFAKLTEYTDRIAELKEQLADGKFSDAEIEAKQKKVEELQKQIDDPATDDETKTELVAEQNKLKEQIKNVTLTDEDKKEIQEEIDKLQQYIDDNTDTAYACMETLREKGCQLTDLWSFYNGGVMFSCDGDTNDPNGITARNITISKAWATGEVRILHTKLVDGLEHSTADDNIMHMIALMSEDMDYYPNEIVDNAMDNGEKKYFTGSFQERLSDMNSILGVETYTTTMLYNNYTATTLSLENSRQSVAGVDLNDEATNMMMYQKSYAAACQLMTTLDSMLDKLINGTLR